MKRRCVFLVILIIIYIFIQSLISNKNYKITYIIDNNNEQFEIIETKYKNDKYLFEISHKDKSYSYLINNSLHNQNNIKQIEYYAFDNIECILPVFENNEIYFDITCNYNNELIFYHNMSDVTNNLLEFKELLSKKYNLDKFYDNSINYYKSDLLMINNNNIVDNYKLALTNYKGISIINNKIVNKNIFSTDKYNRNISLFVNNYYITADYNKTYDFNNFYVVDITREKVFEIKSDYDIAFDSILQGYVNNSIYLLDIENKRQYEVNIKNKSVKKIGNIDGTKYYYNNKWIDISFDEAIEKGQFTLLNNRNMISNDIFQDNIEDIIYTYEKENSYYKLYLSYKETPKIKIYLFNIYNINSIKYIDDYIYYIQDNELNYYHPMYGNKTIIKSDELTFNKNIIYTVIK